MTKISLTKFIEKCHNYNASIIYHLTALIINCVIYCFKYNNYVSNLLGMCIRLKYDTLIIHIMLLLFTIIFNKCNYKYINDKTILLSIFTIESTRITYIIYYYNIIIIIYQNTTLTLFSFWFIVTIIPIIFLFFKILYHFVILIIYLIIYICDNIEIEE